MSPRGAVAEPGPFRETVSAELLDALENPGASGPVVGSKPDHLARPVLTPPRHRHRRRRAVTSWLDEHRLSLSIVAGLCLLTGIVQAVGVSGWPARYDDEGTYVAQAWAFTHLGELAPYTYWYDHPPVGWMMLGLIQAPLSLFVHPANAITAGRLAMLFVDAASSALVYALARRLGMNRAFAALALVIYAVDPLALDYHRMVWLDNLAMPWLLAAFVFALSPRRRLWDLAASGICFALALLSKETFLLLAPALLVAVWQGTDTSTRRYAITIFTTATLLVLAFYPLSALVKNELVPGAHHVSLFGGLSFQLFTRQGSGSIFTGSSLSHKYVAEWFYLDRILPILAVALTVPALFLRRLRPVGVALAVGLLVMLRPGYLPAMYLIALLPFAALVVAGCLNALWNWRPRRLLRGGPALAAVALVALGAVAVPAWARWDVKEMTFNADLPLQQAEKWIFGHVPHSSRMLVDDTFWLDLVQHGFGRNRVVWYYKLGSDSAVDARFPQGWRDFAYVISSDVMRSGATPQALQAIAHSQPVVSFGTGSRRIVIRRIHA